MKTNTAGRRLRQSELDQYNASSALYGLAAGVDKTPHDVSYAGAGGGVIAVDSSSAAALRNNEYARMRLQRLVGGQPPYHRDGGGAPPPAPYRDGAVPYGQPCDGRLPPALVPHGVVEHVYESPDLVRRDAVRDDRDQYTPTKAPVGHHHQQPSPHHGYWPLPPTSPGDSPPQTGVKAKNTGNYSL